MSHRGFSLIELTAAMAVIGLVLTGGLLLTFRNLTDSREEETITRLSQFKRAIVGDARIVTKESRTDFGYVGDMGVLPSSLDQLWIQGAGQTTFVFSGTSKVGSGWQGPYVPVGPLETFNEIGLDSWGNGIVYTVGIGTSTTTGQQYRARLISYGPNGDSGGGDDLTMEIYRTEMLSEVVGYIRDAAKNPMAGVDIKINFPKAIGAASSASCTVQTEPLTGARIESCTVQTGSAGAFTFTDIPFGNRSIEVQPKLVYVPGSGATTPPNTGNIVEFVAQNFSSSDITFNAFKAVYLPLPQGRSATNNAFYEKLTMGNQQVFSSTSDRRGDNEVVLFASQPQTVLGAGSITGQTFPIRIQSPFTQVPDQNIGENASRGGSIRITMSNFVDADTGSNPPNVNMTGVTFTVSMCSGAACVSPSVATFSPVKK